MRSRRVYIRRNRPKGESGKMLGPGVVTGQGMGDLFWISRNGKRRPGRLGRIEAVGRKSGGNY